jgi:hypothetical protein
MGRVLTKERLSAPIDRPRGPSAQDRPDWSTKKAGYWLFAHTSVAHRLVARDWPQFRKFSVLELIHEACQATSPWSGPEAHESRRIRAVEFELESA